MHQRILNIVNLILVLICGASVYFVVTQDYSTPPEIEQAQDILSELEAETGYVATPVTPPDNIQQSHQTLQGKQAFDPFYTPTPTPTPSPTPTPADPVLGQLVHSWKVLSLNQNSAEFLDERTNETFTLTVGGESHPALWKDGTEHPVHLVEVDFSNFQAIVGFKQQTHGIAM